MSKTYQITNNVIYSLNDDGSVSKFATINDNGRIEYIDELSEEEEKPKNRFYKISLVVLILAVIILLVLYNNAKDYYRWQRDETDRLETECVYLEHELDTFKSFVGEKYPVIVTDIEIANVDIETNIETDFGEKIYSSHTMYLMPRIKYFGVIPGDKNFKIKLFRPDGSLSVGDSSPKGYSFEENKNILYGENNSMRFIGWGNKMKGHWSRGDYRIEIWYNDVPLASKKFKIY